MTARYDEFRGRKAIRFMEYRELLTVAVPLWFGSIASNLLTVIGLSLVGHHSVTGFASVAAGSAVFALSSNLILASAITQQILASQRYGAGDVRGVQSAFVHTLLLTGGLAVIATAAVVGFTESIASWVAQSNDVASEAALYMRYRSPELLLLVLFALLRATLNAQKKTRLSMYASIFLGIIGVPLDYCFIYGTRVTPAMGAHGAGLGASVSLAATVGFLAVLAYRHGVLQQLGASGWRFHRDELSTVLRLSGAMTFSAGADYAGALLLAAIIAGFGAASLGGHQIAFQMMFILYGLLASLSGATQILLGQALGARDWIKIQIYRARSRDLLAGMALLLTIPLLLWPSDAVRAFTPFAEIEDVSIGAIRVVAASVPLMAFALGNVGVLRGLGAATYDMLSNVAPVWLIQIPVAWLLGIKMDLGLTGIYIGFGGYWLVRGLAAYILAQRALTREYGKFASVMTTE